MSARVSALILRLALRGLLVTAATLPLTTSAFAQPAAVFAAPLVELVRPTGIVGDGSSSSELYVIALAADGTPLTGLKAKPAASAGTASDLVEVGGGVYRFTYSPPRADGVQQVTITVKTKIGKDTLEKKWAFSVAPAMSRSLSAAMNPSQITLNQDRTASVSFNLAGGDRQALAGVDLAVRASAGTVENITHLGGGQFSALYTAPTVAYPHLAMLTAVDRRDPANTYTAAAVQLVGKADYPVVATPNARVIVRIAGRDFGPIQADATGRAKVPIVVPPGAGIAALVQILPDGTKKEEPLDLRIPETRRVALFPTVAGIPADNRIQVPIRAFVATADGRPDAAAQVAFSATAGVISAARHEGDGVYVALYTPPNGNSAMQATISVTLAEKPALQADSLSVDLVPQRATRLTLTPEPTTLSSTATGFKVFAKAAGHDGAGLGARQVRFVAAGAKVSDVKDLRNGDYQATFTTSGGGSVEMVGGVVTPSAGNPVANVLVLPLRERLAADGTSNTPVVIVTVDQFGYPVPNVPVNLKVANGDGAFPASVTTGADGVAQVAYTAGRTAGWVALDASVGERSASAGLFQVPASVPTPDVPVSGPKGVQTFAAEWLGGSPLLRVEREGAAGIIAAANMEASTSAGARATRAILSAEPAVAAPGGTVLLKVTLQDAQGRGVGGQKLDFLTQGGTLGTVQDLGGGQYTATYTLATNAAGEVRVSVATVDGAASAFLRLSVGGADAWAASPFATSGQPAGTAFGATPAPAPAPAPAAAPAAAPAPAVAPAPAPASTTVTKVTPKPSGRPWLRAHAGYTLASYNYAQEPLTQSSVLFPTSVQIEAGAMGFDAGAKVWLPMFRYVGAEVDVSMIAYSIDPTPLCDELARPCPGADSLTDSVLDARVLLLGRYPFQIGASELSVGARVGWALSDVQVFKVTESELVPEQLAPNSLAVGVEVGAEIGTSLFVEAGFLESLAGGTEPFDTEVDVEIGYAFIPNLYASLGYDLSIRETRVSNTNSTPVGDVTDTTHAGTLSIGVQF